MRNEQRRSNIMTKTTIQPFCRANNYNLNVTMVKESFLDGLQKKIKLCF